MRLVFPYRLGEGGIERPYLRLFLTGPSGPPLPTPGLLDTGADWTVLPIELADLLGHPWPALRSGRVEQPSGSLTAWRSRLSTRAVLPDLPDQPFELDPLFVPGVRYLLWGRQDFLRAWDVLVSERRRRFELRQAA